MSERLRYFVDEMRHLACVPYSVANLHRMAIELGIHRCWYHVSARYPHYDSPKGRHAEFMETLEVVTPREMLAILKGERG